MAPSANIPPPPPPPPAPPYIRQSPPTPRPRNLPIPPTSSANAKQATSAILGKLLAIHVDDDHGPTTLTGEELATLNAALTDYTKLFNSNAGGMKDLTLLTWFQWNKPMKLVLTSTGLDTLIDPRVSNPTDVKEIEYKRLLDKRIISLIRSHINAEVLRRVDEKAPFISTLHFWTVLTECFTSQSMMRRIGHFEQAIGMAFRPNRDDNHLIVDRIIQESEIAMNGGFLTERELASVGCVRAFGKHFPDDRSHFERRGIADLDEIRAHVLAMDNQVRMTREAGDRERGGRFVPHHRANPAIDEVFAATVDESV